MEFRDFEDLKNNPEFLEAMKGHEDRKKYVERQRRLLTLAKQSPFAAANDDFLSLMESKIEDMEQKFEIMEMILQKIKEGP